MGTKNIFDSFQQHITDTIRKVHEGEKPKPLSDKKQEYFKLLCRLQNNNQISYYRACLNDLKFWIDKK